MAEDRLQRPLRPQRDPIPILDEWCMGYMKGVQLDPEGWLLVTAGKPDWLSTIILYGNDEGWEVLDKKNLSLDEHREVVAGLSDTARNAPYRSGR